MGILSLGKESEEIAKVNVAQLDEMFDPIRLTNSV